MFSDRTKTAGARSHRFGLPHAGQWAKVAAFAFMIATMGEYRIAARSPDEALDSSGFDLQIRIQAAIWCLLAVFALYTLVRKRIHCDLVVGNPIAWYGAFLVIALFSAIYSPVPAMALFRAGQLLTLIILVIWFNPSVDDVYLAVAVFLVMNWLGYLVLPPPVVHFTEDVARFCSMFAPQPNGVGSTLAIGATGLYAKISDRRSSAFVWILLLFSITTIILTRSRSAILGLALGLVVASVFRERGRRMLLLTAGCAAIVLLLSDAAISLVVEGFTRGRVEDVSTLTGRVDVWKEATVSWLEAPILGKGYRCMRVELIPGLTGTDSLVFDALVQLGLVGLFLLIGMLVSFVAGAVRLSLSSSRICSSRGIEILAMACPILVYSVTSATFAGTIKPLVVVSLLLWVATYNLVRETTSSRAALRPAASTRGMRAKPGRRSG